MVNRRRWWALLPPQLRKLPADLAAVILLTGATVFVATFPVVDQTPLRIVLGLPFVLFLPGYALIAALFPEQGAHADSDPPDPPDDAATPGVDHGGIDGIERVALSFGLSIAVVPLVGLVLNFTPWGIRLVPILLGVGGVTVGCTVIAAHRRWELPPEERFCVPYRQWYTQARGELFEPDTRTDAALNVLLVLSILIATASVGYAVAVPKQGESFTEFYVLTENEDGDLVADNYPTEFVRGEGKPLVVGIGNQEHQATNYTVVVELQAVDVVDNETEIRDRQELSRVETQLPHNETWHHEYDVRPTMTGTRLRLQLLLYEGDAPADPRMETAYRDLHLWINVSEASG